MNCYITREDTSSSTIKHHGVKGMHWGVIREDKNNKSSQRRSKDKTNNKKNPDDKDRIKKQKREEKAINFEKKAEKTKDPKLKAMYLKEAKRAREGKLSRRQRQVIVGAALVTTYAVYKIADSGEFNRLVSNGKAYINKTSINNWTRNSSLADKNLSPDEIMSKVVSRINDDYGKPGTMNNCRRCTFAYVQSRQGFDVAATKSMTATGQTATGMYNAITDQKKIKGGTIGALRELYTNYEGDYSKYLGGEKKDIQQAVSLGQNRSGRTTAEAIFSALSKLPNNSCGEIETRWDIGGGHSMAWEIVQGKAVIFDAQSRKMYDNPEVLSELADRIKEANYTRLDNIQLDPVMMGRWLKNASTK